jgi:hypothetical protein
MTEQSTYTPQPPFTQQEIDDLVSFIEARVEPLLNAALTAADYPSGERKALQALLNLAAYMKGYANAEISDGENPIVMFHSLALVARQWDEHPDFQPSWAADYVRS